MKLRYNIDESGYIQEIGYISSYEIELNDEPFSLSDAHCWRKDIITCEWIYLPDVTPVNTSITEVRYDWPAEKVFITIADQFRPGPYEFDCTGTWTDADCQAAIEAKFVR